MTIARTNGGIEEKFPNLKKMQELKEEFRKIYETSKNPTEGLLSISEWLAKSSSVFTKSCQTIRNWFGEIIFWQWQPWPPAWFTAIGCSLPGWLATCI